MARKVSSQLNRWNIAATTIMHHWCPT